MPQTSWDRITEQPVTVGDHAGLCVLELWWTSRISLRGFNAVSEAHHDRRCYHLAPQVSVSEWSKLRFCLAYLYGSPVAVYHVPVLALRGRYHAQWQIFPLGILLN